jgi:hypothetical protein
MWCRPVTDLYLYDGDTPPSDVTLADPTVPRQGSGAGTAIAVGVAAVWAIGVALGTGAALQAAVGVSATWNSGPATVAAGASSAPAGVGATWAEGDEAASGGQDAPPLSSPAPTGGGGGVGVRGLSHGWAQRAYPIQSRDRVITLAVAGVARPAGVSVSAQAGVITATTATSADLVALPAVTVIGGAVRASGVRNPTDDEWALIVIAATEP